MFPADVLAWVQATQPNAWEALTKKHGAQACETLLARTRDQLDQRGTLDVLRHGVELLGLKQPLKLAEFKPALAINADILARYAANRLRVVRQVRYSLHNENCIDIVLFVNGLAVATVELKTDFTQSIGDAIDQYRFDRNPRPKGQAAEPLLSFPNGTLVRFAVSNCEVHMVNAGKHSERIPGLTLFPPLAHDNPSHHQHPRLPRPELALLARRRVAWIRVPVGSDRGQAGRRRRTQFRDGRHDHAGANAAVAARCAGHP